MGVIMGYLVQFKLQTVHLPPIRHDKIGRFDLGHKLIAQLNQTMWPVWFSHFLHYIYQRKYYIVNWIIIEKNVLIFKMVEIIWERCPQIQKGHMNFNFWYLNVSYHYEMKHVKYGNRFRHTRIKYKIPKFENSEYFSVS